MMTTATSSPLSNTYVYNNDDNTMTCCFIDEDHEPENDDILRTPNESTAAFEEETPSSSMQVHNAEKIAIPNETKKSVPNSASFCTADSTTASMLIDPYSDVR